MRLFKRKHKSLQSDQLDLRHASGYLQGHTDGLQAGYDKGFDEGFAEGYNEGRAKALEEFKAAAMKAINKNGETENGKQRILHSD